MIHTPRFVRFLDFSLAIALGVASAAGSFGCASRCLPGYVERDAVCVSENGDGGYEPCVGAPIGRYEGLTDQGLPVSFELNAERSRVVRFAIDIMLLSDDNRPTHQIRLPQGLPMFGCGFADVVINSEFSGTFLPPNRFVGAYFDSFLIEGTSVILPASGQWTATFVPADGGIVDGGAGDGGALDGVEVYRGAVDGGAVDGGAVDGGAVDGGAVDGGAVDGGAVDGGAVAEVTVPAGFTADVVARDLFGPFALAVDPVSGLVYVAEQLSGEVRTVDPASGMRNPVATGLFQPSGIALVNPGTPTGKLVVAHGSELRVTPLGGGAATVLGGALAFRPGPIACASAELCFVADYSSNAGPRGVYRVTPAGATLAMAPSADGGVNLPFGVVLTDVGALVAEANLGASDNPAPPFHELDVDGGVAHFTATPPTGITGALAYFTGTRYFVAEAFGRGSAARKVQILDRSLRTSRTFAEVSGAVTALAYDGARGALYVADFSRGLLYRIRGAFGSL